MNEMNHYMILITVNILGFFSVTIVFVMFYLVDNSIAIHIHTVACVVLYRSMMSFFFDIALGLIVFIREYFLSRSFHFSSFESTSR